MELRVRTANSRIWLNLLFSDMTRPCRSNAVRQGAAESEASDIPRVLKILRDAKYSGWFTLEYERDGDPFVEIPEIVKTLKPLLA